MTVLYLPLSCLSFDIWAVSDHRRAPAVYVIDLYTLITASGMLYPDVRKRCGKGNLALTRLAEMAEQDGYLLLQYG